MKTLVLAACLCFGLFNSSAFAATSMGNTIGDAQTNCNIQTGGSGVISNCLRSGNGLLVCDCEDFAPAGPSGGGYGPGGGGYSPVCSTSMGNNIRDAINNCRLQSSGQGRAR